MDLIAKLEKLALGLDSWEKVLRPIQEKWSNFGRSFDVVMQSFEERYARHMKTAALVISFCVVVVMNVNFFDVFQRLSTDDAKRQLLIDSRQKMFTALADKARNTTEASDDPTLKDLKAQLNGMINDVDEQRNAFAGYGIEPLTYEGVTTWATDIGSMSLTDQHWRDRRKRDLVCLFGWSIMTLLLSVGAPFWQDFLESLFGIKNLLRKGTNTRNVENEAGAGQPKQA
jgi:hypothetical protein